MRTNDAMTTTRSPRGWAQVVAGIVLISFFAVACTPTRDSGNAIAWSEVPTPTTVPTVPPEPTATETSTGVGAASNIPVVLGADDLLRVQPNELGHIPVLMYHAFTNNPEYLDQWTVTYDTFREHLTWLYENDFYITPLLDLINNEIQVPPGKHPVVLTFDDSSSGQFKLVRNDDGSLEPDPGTAVGILEEFSAKHPDFGRGGLFAVVPTNCFWYQSEEASCEERLAWLSNNGYEVANHTWWHENLHTVSDDLFRQQVGQTKIWIDERVRGDSNLSNVLILPFGEWPRNDAHVEMLFNGFVYDGQDILIAGVVEVSGGPAPSPSSGHWSRMSIKRFNTDPDQWAHWTGLMESGAITLFVSDGNPAMVTIPNQLSDDLHDHWDADWASAYGMKVVRYDLPDAEDDRAALPNARRERRGLTGNRAA